MKRFLIINTGDRYNRLTLVKEVAPYICPKTSQKNRKFLCLCDCGSTKIFRLNSLRSGHTKSCGCLQKEKAILTGKRLLKHGMTQGRKKTRFYMVWCDLKQRCCNPKNSHYPSYGGRGIKVCKRWEKFENFRDDMLSSYKNHLTIDRVNNDGDYEPSNCRWATRKENARNTSRNKVYEGKCVTEWAEELGINLHTFRDRVYRNGYKETIEYYRSKKNEL